MSADAATASAGGSGADDGASSVVNQLPRWSRSGSGTPSSSLITVNGSGKAKPLTRSTTVSPHASRLSSSRSVIAWTRGRRASIRRRLNAAEASRRRRVWSGGSTLSTPHSPGTGQALGDDRPVPGECGVHVLGQAGVVESGLRLLVADDQPCAVPVGELDLVYRAVRPDLGEQWVRVVSVVIAPRVECRVAHLDHLDLTEA